MKSFPVIGLPTLAIPPGPKPPRFGINQSYVRALAAAGCAPVLIPILDDDDRLRAVYERLDGIVFPGGADVAPEEYGEAPIDNLNVVDTLSRLVADGEVDDAGGLLPQWQGIVCEHDGIDVG